MGTSFVEIITTAAMPIIDDERWTSDLANNPALFFRSKSDLVLLAVPMMNKPPALRMMLENGISLPAYAEAEWTSNAESLTGETTVETGQTGYGFMSCVRRDQDSAGNVVTIPYSGASYNAETGVVTFAQQSDVNIVYELDFYTDGSFANELTYAQKRLLGMAIACVWDERLERNWLNIQPKIHDSSFETVNEANYMDKSNRRMLQNRAEFHDALKKYEQDCTYYDKINVSLYDGKLI